MNTTTPSRGGSVLQGTAESKINQLGEIIYDYGKKRFEVFEKKRKGLQGASARCFLGRGERIQAGGGAVLGARPGSRPSAGTDPCAARNPTKGATLLGLGDLLVTEPEQKLGLARPAVHRSTRTEYVTQLQVSGKAALSPGRLKVVHPTDAGVSPAKALNVEGARKKNLCGLEVGDSSRSAMRAVFPRPDGRPQALLDVAGKRKKPLPRGVTAPSPL
ncbi:uncharacterized protein LOC114910566 [Scleropages formosus]|uniref:uncharacterized protein LOC114909830 n=1 Tax=Scleropages formosus TaxID=113540 RepID=UPI0010FAAF93|nr:uncharacterized protein LOC114909830 [Scleropages formosus]XP_029108053.1 uncharacterized protein LOC114910561 [Scleropages formosus]XP_029108060.1 uncharacterized protein LOC114910566 [Scleropages formosus]